MLSGDVITNLYAQIGPTEFVGSGNIDSLSNNCKLASPQLVSPDALMISTSHGWILAYNEKSAKPLDE